MAIGWHRYAPWHGRGGVCSVVPVVRAHTVRPFARHVPAPQAVTAERPWILRGHPRWEWSPRAEAVAPGTPGSAPHMVRGGAPQLNGTAFLGADSAYASHRQGRHLRVGKHGQRALWRRYIHPPAFPNPPSPRHGPHGTTGQSYSIPSCGACPAPVVPRCTAPAWGPVRSGEGSLSCLTNIRGFPHKHLLVRRARKQRRVHT
jgi:hypothetical protein